MTCELTIHLHSNNWYLRPIEDEEKILGPVDYGWHRFNLYPAVPSLAHAGSANETTLNE